MELRYATSVRAFRPDKKPQFLGRAPPRGAGCNTRGALGAEGADAARRRQKKKPPAPPQAKNPVGPCHAVACRDQSQRAEPMAVQLLHEVALKQLPPDAPQSGA